MTTMTPNETSPDQAVEAVARAICCPDGCENTPETCCWEVSTYEAIAAIAAIPATPPPADHTDLIARLRGMVSSDGRAIVCNQRSTNGMCDDILAAADALQAHASPRELEGEYHGLDTPERVCFYEQDFYVLSNFSAFTIIWKGQRFDTSEAVYHWEKFNNPDPTPYELYVLDSIREAPSAHVAFQIGQSEKRLRRKDWDEVKVDVMRDILRAKADQHEYVHRKLLATGDRELVENSWRDDYWGWGPNRDGQNMLGKLWMELRAELRARTALELG